MLDHPQLGEGVLVALERPDDFDAWRDVARALVRAGVAPQSVTWTEPGGSVGSLFAASGEIPPPLPDAVAPRASRAFLQVAQDALLHSDPARFALLYSLLWRLQADPTMMEDAADGDVMRAAELAHAVRRDIHKMRAFVRFRVLDEGEGGERYVAWFEPAHHILRRNARFFVDRFAAMRWSILTPRGSLHWDGDNLAEGPPARREDAPEGDPAEDLWRRYYASIFNPARLKVGAMVKEMPRKYWKNLPEAALIPHLVASAQAREASMVAKGGDAFEGLERPKTLKAIADGIAACRRCPIGCNGTRAVMGEGAPGAALMIVGEQPGDVEEQESRPFVGPAGLVLMQHLEKASIDRQASYVTNAVKHFKFVPKGKRRLHQTPTAGEIDTCRWWVESEREIVRPRIVLALGASAGRSMIGKTVSVQKDRGRAIPLADGSELWITAHPSYLLRLQDGARAQEEGRFQGDLRAVAQRLREFA